MAAVQVSITAKAARFTLRLIRVSSAVAMTIAMTNGRHDLRRM